MFGVHCNGTFLILVIFHRIFRVEVGFIGFLIQ